MKKLNSIPLIIKSLTRKKILNLLKIDYLKSLKEKSDKITIVQK